jgi:pimeloyl-ACP methyl ester carboxylesterase
VNLSRNERRMRGRDDFVAWLAEVLVALQVERTAIAGNSYGGWLAAGLAQQHPELVTHRC